MTPQGTRKAVWIGERSVTDTWLQEGAGCVGQRRCDGSGRWGVVTAGSGTL